MAYTEPYDALDEKTRDITRAINSLKEELEAVDWYNQRVNTTKDQDLKEVMAHNRDEEIEHASMNLEWLRRNMDGWDQNLKTYLFSTGSMLDIEGKSL
ncbi:ferritin-like domain-containing protein [uncultured Sphaerochaeta sp.]|uniref:ferritin-like domain-containing protein n=1 Tax=uncultured Sphaerochaeta sp. TaxID=886478 RepID=UPI002A0A74D1|nr:ferritin-like domain-containing protein [uncultured Sphaerochaeta sp.]